MNRFPFNGKLGLERSFERELIGKITGSKMSRTIFLPFEYLMLANCLGISSRELI